jgi:hypothetical protein
MHDGVVDYRTEHAHERGLLKRTTSRGTYGSTESVWSYDAAGLMVEQVDSRDGRATRIVRQRRDADTVHTEVDANADGVVDTRIETVMQLTKRRANDW